MTKIEESNRYNFEKSAVGTKVLAIWLSLSLVFSPFIITNSQYSFVTNITILCEFIIFLIGGLALAAAAIWTFLESLDAKINPTLNFRNIFAGITFVTVIYSIFDNMKVINFYLFIFINLLIIFTLERLIEKLLSNKRFIQNILKAINTIFWVIAYYFIIATFLTWAPFNNDNFLTNIIYKPAIILSNPIVNYAPPGCDWAVMLLIIFIFKSATDKFLTSKLNLLEESGSNNKESVSPNSENMD